MARPRNDELAAERRQQILTAAAQVFRSKGLHAARMEEVCAEAKLSPGTVYRHFDSKDEVIVAIVEAEFEHYTNLTRTFLGSPEGIETILNCDKQALSKLLTRGPFDVGMEIWLEIERNPRLMKIAARADELVRAEMADALKKAQSTKLVRSDIDVKGAVDILSAFVTGLQVDYEFNPGLDLRRTAKAVSDMLTRYLRPS